MHKYALIVLAGLLTGSAPAFSQVLAVGGFHACATAADGIAHCWGSDGRGQLGHGGGSDNSSSLPVTVNRTFRSLTAGSQFSCGLTAQDRAVCWGDNSYGQLGIGPVATSKHDPSDTNMAAIPSGRLVQLDAGYAHTCGLDPAGNAWCWGWGETGALGNGANPQKQYLPSAVSMPVGVKFIAISAGFDFTCAIDTSAKVWCWGGNASGQLGNSDADQQSLEPVLVQFPAATKLESLSSGLMHACAIDQAAKLWCWGAGNSGQLGDGAGTSSKVPVEVDDFAVGAGFSAVAAAVNSTCALDVVGKVWCWGSDTSGELGDDDARTWHSRPVLVSLPEVKSVVESIAAGGRPGGFSSVCAQYRNGALACWGDGTYGQLGRGWFGWETVPQMVPIQGAVQLTAESRHTCALNGEGVLKCWGSNNGGQLGTGIVEVDSAEPKVVQFPGGVVTALVSAGGQHTCSLDTNGGAWCWGWNGAGQIGAGTSVYRYPTPTPVQMTGVPAGGFTYLDAGDRTTCAIDTQGQLWCWGSDTFGQLGDGEAENTNASSPQRVATGGKTYSRVSVGGHHVCAIESVQRALYCWGDGAEGQLGTGDSVDRSTPAPVSLVSNAGIAAVSAGWLHTCLAQTIAGDAQKSKLWCFGYNESGQVGSGSDMDELFPVGVGYIAGSFPQVDNGALSAGISHTCYRSSYFMLAGCMGGNTLGQLGNGSGTSTKIPQASELGTVSSVAVGYDHSCAIRQDGDVVCVGSRANGQLGDGIIGLATTPQLLNFVGHGTELFGDGFE